MILKALPRGEQFPMEIASDGGHAPVGVYLSMSITRKGIRASTRCGIPYAILPISVPTLVSISIRWGASLRHSAGPAPSASIHSRVFAPAGRCLGAACAHSAGPSPVAYIRRSHQNSSFQGARGLPYPSPCSAALSTAIDQCKFYSKSPTS